MLITLSCSSVFASSQDIYPTDIPDEKEFSKIQILKEENFQVSPMAYTSTTSEAETNDTMGSADSITLSSGRSATIGNSSDVDWFVFTPSSTGKYRFDMSDIPVGTNYQMQLYNSSNTMLAGSSSERSYETIIASLTANAKYYIRIYSASGYSSSKYYVTVTNDACALLNWDYPFLGSNPPREVSSSYGPRDGKKHCGVDISATDGTSIYSATDGVKKYGGFDPAEKGNYAVVQVASGQSPAGYTNSTMVTYMHMNQDSVVANGTTIYKGRLIGYVGNTGNSFGAHLHFQVSLNATTTAAVTYAQTLNPLRFFPNINFTGSPKYTEITTDGFSESLIESSNDVNNANNLIDDTLITYVGIDEFKQWLDTTDGEITLINFLNHFNIDNDLCKKIMQEGGSYEYYDMDSVFEMRVDK